jgi:hypothetical protein
VANAAPSGRSPLRESQLCLPRAAVRLLAACAKSEELCPELALGDALAASFFADLGGSAESFGVGELRCAAFRAWVVDQLARGFFERQPGRTGVSIWPMLGTRVHRLRAYSWLELDAPPLAALRERYLPARDRWTQLASCLCGAGQAAHSVGPPGPRLFVMDEAVLPLQAEAMTRLLDSLSAHAACGSELIFAYDSCTPLRASHRGALELELGTELVRYPRLRFVDDSRYPDELRNSLCGVNAVARLQGHDAPSLVHLVVH